MAPTLWGNPPTLSRWSRWGPILLVVGLLAALVTVASFRDQPSVESAVTGRATSGAGELPITREAAVRAGDADSLDFGPHCDAETGRIAMPSVYAPPCVAARPGLTSTAPTGRGVSPTRVRIAYYELPDDDLAASLGAVLDPPDVRFRAAQDLVTMYSDLFRTWGRTIELVRVKGSGTDDVAARADAVKVAEEVGAFAVIGGPSQKGAVTYLRELASRGVICIECGQGIPDSEIRKLDPFVWGNGQSVEQYFLNLGDFLVKQLNGRPARFAGDPALRGTTRKFCFVHFEQDPPVFTDTSKAIVERGKRDGFVSAITLTYQLVPAELPEKARAIVSRLKETACTTVVFLGDPIMPISLTKAATAQEFFPEWIITGTVLTDTTTLGRLYDQRQWAHAFGISSLGVPAPGANEASRLYRWWSGSDLGAPKTSALSNAPIRLLMWGIHMAGPRLSPTTFRDGLFALPPMGGTPAAPRVSFGDHTRGFPGPDHLAIDDMTLIWWDGSATGPNEQGQEGTGVMRYVDGGRRYLPGALPGGDPAAFDPDRSVTRLGDVPVADRPKEYPAAASTQPPAGGG
jgi:hypothetical protein